MKTTPYGKKKIRKKKKLVHAFHLQQIPSGFLDIHATVIFIGPSHESYTTVVTKLQANLTIAKISIEATIQTGAYKYTKPRLSKSALAVDY